MIGSRFRSYAIALSHGHLPLLVIKAVVALGNTVANTFSLIYLLRQGLSPEYCALFIALIGLTSMAIIAMASRTIVANFQISMQLALVSLIFYYAIFIFVDGILLALIPPLLFGAYRMSPTPGMTAPTTA